MPKTWCFLALLLAICAVPCFSQAGPNLAGDYAGMLGSMHVKLHVIAGSDGSLSATVDLPDQHMFASQCTDLQLNETALSYSVPKFHGTWTGVLSADGNSLTGVWSAGQPQALNMTRVGGGQPAATATVAPVSAAGVAGAGDGAGATASDRQFPTCPMGSMANYWTGTAWAPLHAPQIIGGRQGFSMGAAMKGGPLMAGTMGQTTIEQFKGAESLTTAGSKTAFCFFNGANMNPTYLLGTVGMKGDNREFEIKRATGPEKWIEPKRQQPVEQSLFGNNWILVTPTAPLPPGQYIVGMSPSTIYDFGVK